jgi:hypothetical protein
VNSFKDILDYITVIQQDSWYIDTFKAIVTSEHSGLEFIWNSQYFWTCDRTFKIIWDFFNQVAPSGTSGPDEAAPRGPNGTQLPHTNRFQVAK